MPQTEPQDTWPLPPDNAPTLGGGRFLLAAQLGEGGMARVYRAWDTEDGQWVAVKVLLPEFARKRKLRKRFMNEAHTLLGLDHRHVVKVLAVGEENEDHPFIAMELADGGCVIDWIERYGPMPPRMAIDVVMQACKGLKAAHDQNIVHRDVKPHNILVTRRGVCRLTDFGIARIEDESGGMTRTGSVMGTMGYMAPEQRTDSKAVDARADIYGLGATLYKLLTAGTPTDLFLAEHDTKILAGVSEALVPTLVKATAYNRDQRHASVTDFARELHAAKQALAPDPDDTPPLAMAIDGTIDKSLGTRPELSEPTYPELPSLPSSLQTTDSDKTTTPPTADERSVLPYSMPKQDARRGSDEDFVPDYIDKDSITATPAVRAEEIELDEASKKRAEAAFQRAVAAGRINPDGTPIEEEVVDPHPAAKGWALLESALEVYGSLVTELLSVMWRPLQVFGVGFVVVACFAGVMVMTSAGVVNKAMLEAMTARSALFATIDDNDVILGDLSAMGADEGMIQSFWFDYQNAASKPQKVDAAYKLVQRLHSTFDYQRQHGYASGSRTRIVRERLNRIDLAVDAYEEKMVAWEQEATGPRGRLAISFGAAYRPGDERAEEAAP